MKIGNITLPRTAVLAPMAGVGDRAFREICRKYGSACSIGEMTSAKGLIYSDRKSEELLCLGEAERPGAVQLFGDDPKLVAAAAQKALAWNPDWIDINMGCPAPKIAGSGSGNYSSAWKETIHRLAETKIIVRSSRVLQGIVFDSPFFDPGRDTIPSYTLSPQKARILLMLALSVTGEREQIRTIFETY